MRRGQAQSAYAVGGLSCQHRAAPSSYAHIQLCQSDLRGRCSDHWSTECANRCMRSRLDMSSGFRSCARAPSARGGRGACVFPPCVRAAPVGGRGGGCARRHGADPTRMLKSYAGCAGRSGRRRTRAYFHARPGIDGIKFIAPPQIRGGSLRLRRIPLLQSAAA